MSQRFNRLFGFKRAVKRLAVGFSGFFNQFSGGLAGWSVRLLSETYTGGLIRVRAWDGSADKGQADVMPYVIGTEKWVDMNSLLTNLDATALSRGLTTSSTLSDLVSEGVSDYDGYVPIIYEQLNGFDFQQGAATRQGIIITAGVMNLLNEKPIIERGSDNNSGYLSNGFAPNSGVTNKGWFYLGRSLKDLACIVGSNTDGGDYGYISQLGGTSTTINNKLIPTNERLNGAAWSYTTVDDVHTDLLTQSFISAEAEFTYVDNTYSLGYRFTNVSNIGFVSFQENTIFGNVADTVLKEGNANTAFTIY